MPTTALESHQIMIKPKSSNAVQINNYTQIMFLSSSVAFSQESAGCALYIDADGEYRS